MSLFLYLFFNTFILLFVLFNIALGDYYHDNYLKYVYIKTYSLG